MISASLEITACIIAALFGMLGVFYGLSSNHDTILSTCLVLMSGLLVVLVVIYLSQLAELMGGKGSIMLCKVLNKLIYATIVGQAILSALMV